MNTSTKIIFVFFVFSSLCVAESYLIIQNGNSLFIPLGSQICSNNIIVEAGASYITEDIAGTCENAVVTGNGEILFPVELLSFTANIDKKRNVLLKWETATEVDNFGFDIERSNSNKLIFEKIGFVSGHGNSNSKKSYSFVDKLPLFEKDYCYRLIQINTDGSFSVLNTIKVEAYSPGEYLLFQNYPNPFNPSTKIYYALPELSHLSLKIYDVLGNEIATLVNEEKPAGSYEVQFNGSALSSGIYFYTLRAGNFSSTKKLILMK